MALEVAESKKVTFSDVIRFWAELALIFLMKIFHYKLEIWILKDLGIVEMYCEKM